MKKIAFMFPGQGSQAVGMGKDFYESYPEVQSMFKLAHEVLGADLPTLMFEGPEEKLTETENAQPALLLSSMVAYQLLKNEGIEPDLVLGHSLGEYSALVAANMMTLEEALTLVKERGRLMEQAFPKGQGSMSAVLGLSETEISQAIEQVDHAEVVDIANLNCPGQIVISGSVKGLEQAEKHLLEAGAKRVIRLNVSGPFHSSLMKRAAETFAESLEAIQWQDANIPVYANVTASKVTDRAIMKDLLIKQLYSPVRFDQSIRQMIDEGVDMFVEVGHGKVLRGLVRKINRKIPTYSVQDVDSLQKFILAYKEES